jgi:hypothetical protein
MKIPIRRGICQSFLGVIPEIREPPIAPIGIDDTDEEKRTGKKKGKDHFV